ncbi:MAG: spermidine/putrescine ABC transporter substrate-binding protein [Spirochaetota bacterium]|nr:MAG: spermidine/putrescine ABC transporter substrate-binding protein [Spirochaetota bacterium]
MVKEIKESSKGYKFMIGILTVVLCFSFLTGMALAKPVKTYNEYVASLPAGYQPVPRACFEQAKKEGKLNILIWAEWWPAELFENYSEQFGIDVVQDHYSSYDEVITKFKLYPKAEYDLVIGMGLSGFGRMVGLNQIQKLNSNWVPNVTKYTADSVKKDWRRLGFAEYGIVYCAYFSGYAYNPKYVDDARIPSMAVLLEPNAKYKGRVTLVDDMFEVIGDALIYLGYPVNSTDEKQLMEAKKLLMKLKPHVMAFDTWPKRLLFEEEAWVAMTWMGDAWNMHADLPNLKAALPLEGSTIAYDPIGLPPSSTHPAAAHLFLNYIFRPDANVILTETVGHSPVNTAVPELLSSEELKKWPGAVLSKVSNLNRYQFLNSDSYTGKGLELRTEIWEELKR